MERRSFFASSWRLSAPNFSRFAAKALGAKANAQNECQADQKSESFHSFLLS